MSSNRFENDSEEAFLCSPKYHFQRYHSAPLIAHIGERKTHWMIQGDLSPVFVDANEYFEVKIMLKKNTIWLKFNVCAVFSLKGGGGERERDARLA